jgi:hypothetical protein
MKKSWKTPPFSKWRVKIPQIHGRVVRMFGPGSKVRVEPVIPDQFISVQLVWFIKIQWLIGVWIACNSCKAICHSCRGRMLK